MSMMFVAYEEFAKVASIYYERVHTLQNILIPTTKEKPPMQVKKRNFKRKFHKKSTQSTKMSSYSQVVHTIADMIVPDPSKSITIKCEQTLIMKRGRFGKAWIMTYIAIYLFLRRGIYDTQTLITCNVCWLTQQLMPLNLFVFTYGWIKFSIMLTY